MLGKVLKYDLKAVGKYIFPISLIALLTTAIGCGAIGYLAQIDYNSDNVFTIVSTEMASMVVMASAFALAAFAICTLIVLVQRFYSSFFTDEGYLTFTLPVKRGTLLFSKVLTGVIYSIYSSVIEVGCIFAFISTSVIASSSVDELIFQIKCLFEDLLTEFGINVAVNLSAWIGDAFAMCISSILLIYLSFTIGSVIASKHKVICSVGIYIAISTVQSIIMSTLTFSAMAVSGSMYDSVATSGWWLLITALIGIGISIVLSVVYYILTYWLINKKLNLA